MTPSRRDDLFLALISVHGLIRGREPELGRDADTGGQVGYVLELSRALARHPQVSRVELITRRIDDPRVGPDYARPEEDLGHGAFLVRVPCGPPEYVAKEQLWPHLDEFSDRVLARWAAAGRVPDVLHGHYADAGHVGATLSSCLGVPLVQTGHSLGRVKRLHLREQGLDDATLDRRFNLSRRVEAEERALDHASLIVASTRQERDEQYAMYDNADADRVAVLPPGLELGRFRPPRRGDPEPPIAARIDRFLHQPHKSLVLALARADARKNLVTLVDAFGADDQLRASANLAIVAGTRDDVADLEPGAREVITELLLAVDRHDLWGSVALPKQHDPDEVPDIYRLAARRHGVFVNAALTEPFGLTLLEAGASGLPVVATHDGGPCEILERCGHGVLVDPLDPAGVARAVRGVIDDHAEWRRRADKGVRGVRRHYTWDAHVKSYLRSLTRETPRILRASPLALPKGPPAIVGERPAPRWMLACDLDRTLSGDREGAAALSERIAELRDRLAFVVATGRHAASAVEELERWGLPRPDALIGAVGSEIHDGAGHQQDKAWTRHIDFRWNRDGIVAALADVDGLSLQRNPADQRRHKVSYDVDADRSPPLERIVAALRQAGVHARAILSAGRYLDVLPVHAGKGYAVRFIAGAWGLPADRLVTAGDSGNDLDMLSGHTRGVVVADHHPELETLRDDRSVYFASAAHAWGVLEGLDHWLSRAGEGPVPQDGAGPVARGGPSSAGAPSGAPPPGMPSGPAPERSQPALS